MKKLKDTRASVTKDEMERMYKISYYIDKGFFKPLDVVDLGLDIHRLKEFGEVRMTRPWPKLRSHAGPLWARMTDPMKVMYWWSFLCEGIDLLKSLLDTMEPFVKNVNLERKSLETVVSSMCQKLPPELHAKIKEGFGREWDVESREGTAKSG